MTIYLPQSVLLSPDWEFPTTSPTPPWGSEFEDWTRDQLRAIEDIFGEIYKDFAEGTSTLLPFSSTPTVSDLEPGRLGLANNKLYFNDAGTIRVLNPSPTATYTYRVGHTYTIAGEIKVASGDTDFILPFFVSLATSQTAKLVKCRYIINSGTSATIKIQKNGSDATGFTGMSVTTTVAETDPADVTLADNDKLAVVVTAVSGTPTHMSVTLFIEHTQTT